MCTPERVAVALLLALLAPVASSAAPEGPRLGVPASADEVAAWDISIPPDGTGLPAGSGTALEGARIYAAKCSSCHGEAGAGKPNDALAGGSGTLATASPVRTVGSYWPYATTLFDYIRRAMPYFQPQSLTGDELYALTAYILHVNGIVGEDATMDAKSLPRVVMPNRDNFVSAWPAVPEAAISD